MAGWLPHQDKDETQRILDIFIGGRDTFAIVKDDKVIGSVGIKNSVLPNLLHFPIRKAANWASSSPRIIGDKGLCLRLFFA